MITEVAAAFSGIKAALDVAQGMSSLKTESDRNAAIISIQRTLLESQSNIAQAQMTIAALSEEISSLKSQQRDHHDWAQEVARYALTQSAGGAFTYDLKADATGGEVFHRLCANCFSSKRKAILHIKAKHSGGEIVTCQACKTELQLSDFTNTIISVGRYDDEDDWVKSRRGY